MFLYGKNSILERLRRNPKSIKKIMLQDNFNVLAIEDLVKKNKIPAEYLSARKLARLKPAKNVQGILACVDSFKYVDFNALLKGQPPGKKTALVFLDRINDPQNLGMIMRTLACFGGFSVIIPDTGACSVTEAVLHVASGADNYVGVSIVPDLSQAIASAKKYGYFIIGAVVDDKAEDINKIAVSFPLGLVLGSEVAGISGSVKKQLDRQVCINMPGANLSLNVSMACCVFCHEIAKHRKKTV